MIADASAAARVHEIFQSNFVRGVEVGASVAVWQNGAQAFCFYHGWRDGERELHRSVAAKIPEQVYDSLPRRSHAQY